MQLSRNKIYKLLNGNNQTLKINKKYKRGSGKGKRTFRKKRQVNLRNKSIKKIGGGGTPRKKTHLTNRQRKKMEKTRQGMIVAADLNETAISPGRPGSNQSKNTINRERKLRRHKTLLQNQTKNKK